MRLAADEEKAVARRRMDAIDQGWFVGMAPTGRRVTLSGIDIYPIVGGELAEHWHDIGALDLMQHLAVFPVPEGLAQDRLTAV